MCLKEGKVTKKPVKWTGVNELSYDIWVIFRGVCFCVVSFENLKNLNIFRYRMFTKLS